MTLIQTTPNAGTIQQTINEQRNRLQTALPFIDYRTAYDLQETLDAWQNQELDDITAYHMAQYLICTR